MAPLVVAAAVAAAPYQPQVVEVGTFDLGDLVFATSNSERMRKKLRAAGVDTGEVKKGLNGVEVHLLDYQVRGKDGRRTWLRQDGGRWGPKVLIEGRLTVEGKEKAGEAVEVVVSEVKAIGVGTDNDARPADVRCVLHLTVRFNGLAVREGVIVSRPKEGGIGLPAVRYDTTGRVTVERE